MIHIKLKKSDKSKFYILLIVVLFTFIVLSACSYAKSVSSHLSSSVFRLHVIANSDTDFDQELKYKVRDALIEYMDTLIDDSNTKSEVISIANSHIDDFYSVAQNVIYENGYNYNVNVEIGNFYFPAKVYGDISFPSGMYDALEVKIGNAAGRNWWCVMFPPLCFVDVTSGIVPEDSKENLKDNLSEDEFNLISSDDGFSELRFKIVDIFNNISSKIAR